MTAHSAQPSTVKPSSRLQPLPIGDRRDAKQENPFHAGFGVGRRSLTQEMLADRKR